MGESQLEAGAQRKSKLRYFLEETLNILLSPYRFFKWACFLTGFCVIVAGLGLSIYIYTFLDSLPALDRWGYQKLQSMAQKRIAERRDSRKPQADWVNLKDVNRDYLYSLVMSEDAAFFEHEGIDYDAIFTSFAVNLKEKKPVYGGSTISQQVVKNLFLSNERTLMRKIKELLITRRLERNFKKNQILELYFNLAEFGPDIFGVEEAANHYFGKSSSKINAAEGAFLAIMLPSPRKYHYAVFQNKNLTKSKRKKIQRILNDMAFNGFISQQQYRVYLKYDFYSNRSLANATTDPSSHNIDDE